MFDWLHRALGRPSAAPQSRAEWVTTRDQWTIPGVYFDAAGWQLTEASAAHMSWVGCFGGTMTLTKRAATGAPRGPIDLDAARREHRARATEARGGLVSVETVKMARGPVALEVITKHHQGLGFGFDGRLLIDTGPDLYMLQMAVDERMTGVRESAVSSLRIQLRDPDMIAMLTRPAGADGGRPIPGMKLDPYDSAFDDAATYSASDDPRIDVVFQTHPLAVIRSTLRRAEATWESASGAGQTPQPLPPSSGPKVVLSDRVVQELCKLAKKAVH